MKRRILPFTLLAVSLLSCNQVQLRSDISDFIASFSLVSSLEKYRESKYLLTITSVEGSDTIYQEDNFSFNVKDDENITYKFTSVKKKNGEVLSSINEEIKKSGDEYYYYKNDEEPIEKTVSEIKNDYIKKFFYKDSSLDIYTQGMYIADWLKSVIVNIQDCVTIDQEKHQLTYNKPRELKDNELDFEEIMVVDSLGMIVTTDIVLYHPQATRTTHIEVYNFE